MDIANVTYAAQPILPFSPDSTVRTVSPASRSQRQEQTTRSFGENLVLNLAPRESEQDSSTRSALAKALDNSMKFIRENFGEEAQAAAMVLVARRIDASGDTDEETLSKGLLDVLRMVDRNHGMAAGDSLMSQFNGELNAAINDFFDNGSMEKFYAAGQKNPVAQAIPDVMSHVMDTYGRDTAGDVATILRETLDQKLSPSSLRSALQKATTLIGDRFGADAGQAFSMFAGNIMGEMGQDQTGLLQTGALLDIAV